MILAEKYIQQFPGKPIEAMKRFWGKPTGSAQNKATLGENQGCPNG